ncbi:hypothetical protein J4714_14535 [Staphylococcus epidermidis]|nr:hypothetical protein [Staphylococcus epidermidis]
MVKAMLEISRPTSSSSMVPKAAQARPVDLSITWACHLQEGLLLVHSSLSVNLRHRIKIGAGKVITFDIARMMALGADWCNSGRGFMMALGCIQAATLAPAPQALPPRTVRQKALVVPTGPVAPSTATPCMRCKSWCRRPGSNTPKEITPTTLFGA